MIRAQSRGFLTFLSSPWFSFVLPTDAVREAWPFVCPGATGVGGSLSPSLPSVDLFDLLVAAQFICDSAHLSVCILGFYYLASTRREGLVDFFFRQLSPGRFFTFLGRFLVPFASSPCAQRVSSGAQLRSVFLQTKERAPFPTSFLVPDPSFGFSLWVWECIPSPQAVFFTVVTIGGVSLSSFSALVFSVRARYSFCPFALLFLWARRVQ